jgi:hypothetical protein
MPTKRRRITRKTEGPIDPVSAFSGWTVRGCGYGNHSLCQATYADETAARAAWPLARRAVWGSCHRMFVPLTAATYDGLTMEGRSVIHATWNLTAGLNLVDVRAALDADAAAIVAFEQADPAGARDIAGFLALWRADLAKMGAIAEQLKNDPYAGAYTTLSTAATYNDQETIR